MENLRQLMAAYFHQDWWDEYDGSWEGAVDDFARREPHRVPATIEEITVLLDADDSDTAVGETLDALGNYRHAGEEPDAHSTWLRQIRERLAQAT